MPDKLGRHLLLRKGLGVAAGADGVCGADAHVFEQADLPGAGLRPIGAHAVGNVGKQIVMLQQVLL